MLTFTVLAAAQAFGGVQQSRPDPGSIRGRVLLPNGAPLSQPVKVTLSVMRGDESVLYTDDEGLFEIRGLSPGSYTIQIEDDRERKYESISERVTVYPRSPVLVTLYLKEKGGAVKEKPSSDTVSAAEFEQNVPSAALKEFERATRAEKDGKPDEAVAHLRKALDIYPDYLKARNDLGTYLLAQGKLDEAADELRAAIKIDPKAFNPRLNLGIVLVHQHEFSDASETLEKALSLNAASPAVHLYAGLARLGLNEFDRAERELSVAYALGGSEYALAQFHLGQLYMSKGERALALKAFETYLRDKPDAANAQEVRRLIPVLR